MKCLDTWEQQSISYAVFTQVIENKGYYQSKRYKPRWTLKMILTLYNFTSSRAHDRILAHMKCLAIHNTYKLGYPHSRGWKLELPESYLFRWTSKMITTWWHYVIKHMIVFWLTWNVSISTKNAHHMLPFLKWSRIRITANQNFICRDVLEK